MNKLKLIISLSAETDIEQYAIHIAKDKKEVAEKFLDEFWNTCELLREMPAIGKRVNRNFPEIHKLLKDVRSWHIKNFLNYLVFYKKSQNKIIILRVINVSRDLSGIFEE